MDKQIFAALEIADGEIRLVVGEFFNTRFNVIKVERVLTSGVEGVEIVNKDAVISSIRKAVDNASKLIGAKIERVLLCIPSVGMKRYPLKITVAVDSIVQLADVSRAVRKAMDTKLGVDDALINVVCVKYTCNGITTRRIPINEKCDSLTVDIDLLCADKDIAFEYVGIVENCGLEILDISLDIFATAKEAALFEQTVDQNIIVLKVERNITTLGLFSKGKLISTEIMYKGLGLFISEVCDKTDLPTNVSSRLIKYNCNLYNKNHLNSPVYIWAQDGKTNTLSETDLYNLIIDKVNTWVDDLSLMCKEIIEASNVTVVITGEGAEMQGLKDLIKDKLNVDVKNYFPETLGVRNGSLSSVLGLFYSFKDQLAITCNKKISVDLFQFNSSVEIEKIKQDDESFTSKLKGMLFEAKKREDQ